MSNHRSTTAVLSHAKYYIDYNIQECFNEIEVKHKGCLDWDSFPTFLRLFSDTDAQMHKKDITNTKNTLLLLYRMKLTNKSFLLGRIWRYLYRDCPSDTAKTSSLHPIALSNKSIGYKKLDIYAYIYTLYIGYKYMNIHIIIYSNICHGTSLKNPIWPHAWGLEPASPAACQQTCCALEHHTSPKNAGSSPHVDRWFFWMMLNIHICVYQGLLYYRTCKRDFLCSWPSLNSYLK